MSQKTQGKRLMNYYIVSLDQLGFHMEFGEIPTEEERKVFSDLLFIDLNQK